MKHLTVILPIVLAACLAASGCGNRAGQGASATGQAQANQNGTAGAQNGQPPIPVAVEPAEIGPIASY